MAGARGLTMTRVHESFLCAHRSFRAWRSASRPRCALSVCRLLDVPSPGPDRRQSDGDAEKIRHRTGRGSRRDRAARRPRPVRRLGDAQRQIYVYDGTPPTMPPYAVNKDQATCGKDPACQGRRSQTSSLVGRRETARGSRMSRSSPSQGIARESRGLGPMLRSDTDAVLDQKVCRFIDHVMSPCRRSDDLVSRLTSRIAIVRRP